MDINAIEIDCLRNSNEIEGEFSDIALEDSMKTWVFAKKHKGHVNLKLIKGIHKRLMRRLNPRIAGKLRRVQVGVITKQGFKKAIHWSTILAELNHLCNQGVYPVFSEQMIKDWHIHFEHIHPFEDGNGRVGRIIMNIQRLNEKLPLLNIHRGKEQFEYYKWFT